MTDRLNRADWDLINAALAFYEAEDLEDVAETHGVDVDDFYEQIKEPRRKVHQRLP